LEEAAVLVISEKHELIEIINEKDVEAGKIEKLKGVITPGFINAHCHLELSHLKNKIPERTGLPAFGKQIMLQRNSQRTEEISEKINDADKEMREQGIVAVGDISNSDISFKIKSESKIKYHTFVELLGLNPERAQSAFEAGISLMNTLRELGIDGSLAPHAAYSTSLKLIEMISSFNLENKLPSSIHNQESEEETKFLNGEPSGFDELYRFLQMDIAWFKPPMKSSIQYYSGSLHNQTTILVHNTFTSANDISLAKAKNIYWCFCPSANLYIENKLPDYSLFMNEADKICLGTDSLASNHDLSIVKEANLVLANSNFSVEQILASLTSVPAAALNFSGLGHLKIGKNAGLNLVEINNNQIRFIKNLT
jgi:cytosine/adenosine deaminase-related metal-dependent hydrolase